MIFSIDSEKEVISIRFTFDEIAELLEFIQETFGDLSEEKIHDLLDSLSK
jgi:hypothetical protein